MDLPECPYCYAAVMARPDGSCPACRRNIAEAPEENFNYSAVEITADQALPSCCISCGTDTEHIEGFEFVYDSHLGGDLDENSYFAFMLVVVMTLGLGYFLLPLYRRRLRKYRKIAYYIALPYCASCLPNKPSYRPITIEGRAFHFKVHKTFKARLRAAESVRRFG